MKITPAGLALLVATGFAGGIAVGPGSGLLGRQFGITAAAARGTDAGSDSTYGLLTLFGNVMERAAPTTCSRFRPHADRKRAERHADRPRSAQLLPDEQQWHDMQTETAGHFGGIGLEVTDNDGAAAKW